MEKYIQYINEFHNSNPIELTFVRHHLQQHLKENEENQTEIESILDFLYSNQSIDISKIGYTTLLEKTEKWHKKLQSVAIKDKEEEGKDYTVYMDFEDGFKIVKLVSKESYEREGKLMSHCVSSYYGRDSKIYSLRDKKNLPHCTIEDGSQIKGKGNGKIDPKYIDYIVKFLEKTGMTVGENEMKNLGYYKLEKIDNDLTSNSLYNGYIYENKLDTLKDKSGNIYKGFGLLNIKDLVEFSGEFSFKINFDIASLVSYCISLFKETYKVSNKEDEVIGSSGDSAQIGSSGHSAQIGSSGSSAKIGSSGYYAQIGSSGYSAQIGSSGNSAKIGSSGHSAQIGSSGNSAKIGSSGYSAQIGSSGNSAKIGSSGNSAKIGSSGDSAQIGSSGSSAKIGSSGYYAQIGSSGDYAKIGSSGHSAKIGSSGYYAQIGSSGDYAQISVEGNYSIVSAIGADSKAKGISGTWIVLAEYGQNSEGYLYPINVKCGQIDGTILKENTFYTLKNGEFTETE